MSAEEFPELVVREPWARVPGEGSRQYAAFCHYRDLGKERSITKGVVVYLTGACPRNSPQRARQQRRYKGHARPHAYLQAVRGQWRRWSSRFGWVSRCQAYDDHIAALAQKEEEAAAVRLRQAQIAEEEEQARTRLGTLRLGRQIPSAFFARLARIIATNEGRGLEGLTLDDLLRALPKLTLLLDIALKHERAELQRQQKGGKAEEAEEGAGAAVRTLARQFAAEVASALEAEGVDVPSLQELRAHLEAEPGADGNGGG